MAIEQINKALVHGVWLLMVVNVFLIPIRKEGEAACFLRG